MTPLTALLWFAAWTLFLIVLVLIYRSGKILGGTPANAWTRGQAIEDPPVVKRIADAHLNCLENLPIFAVLVLVAASQGKTALLIPLAGYVLYARLLQSITHIIGTRPLLVTVRATFWIIQIILFAWMFKDLLS